MTTLSITKTYSDGAVLTEAMLDNFKNDVETWANNGNFDNTNINLGGVLRFTYNGNDEITFTDATDTFTFKVDGTNVFNIVETATDITLKSLISNSDLLFDVNDGGVNTTGLSVKGSDARVKIHVGLSDSNSNEIVDIGATASAINQVKISNAAIGNAPKIEALGDDTNVNLELDAKGTGIIKLNQAGVPQVVTLTDAATIATDASLGNIFTVTLTDNRTLGTPTNLTNGQVMVWRIVQDATGSRTITLASGFTISADITLTLSTAANAIDYLGGIYNSTSAKVEIIAFSKNIS